MESKKRPSHLIVTDLVMRDRRLDCVFNRDGQSKILLGWQIRLPMSLIQRGKSI